MPLMIKCTSCKEKKELHKFYENKKGRNGRQSRCKACMIKAGKAYYRKPNKSPKLPLPVKQLRKSFDTAIRANAYDAKRAISAALLMFLEATPTERAGKMRVIDRCFK